MNKDGKVLVTPKTELYNKNYDKIFKKIDEDKLIMRKELSEDEAKGLTIEEFSYSITSGQMIVTLSGGNFICFGIDKDYYNDTIEIINEKLELLDFGDDKLIKVGVISKDELETLKKQEHDTWEEGKIKMELQQYKQLHKKYGSI